MSKECKCEHWQQCPVCMPNRFSKNGHLLPPEPTPLQAARIRIEELEREIERKMSAAAFVLKERDALQDDNAELVAALKPFGAIDLVESRLPAEFAMLILRARTAIAKVRKP